MSRIYLDHNASAPMHARVRAALLAGLAEAAGNPSSPHREGQAARIALESAREVLARFAGAAPEEVLFTSGGTESNNMALRGLLGPFRHGGKGRATRLITTPVEHPSILEPARRLEEEGIQVERLPVDHAGRVDPASLEALLEQEAADLVSVIHGNNETGVLQPVAEIGRICRARGVPFHTDAVQSACWLPAAEWAGVADLVTLAGHKLGGPPGIGCLLLRRGTPFSPLLTGGAQEGRKRAGTEPAALAGAWAEAIRILGGEADEQDPGSGDRPFARIEELRNGLEEALREMIPGCRIHGSEAPRLPNTTNVFFPGAPGRMLVIRMDLAGIAVSTGSACSTGSSRPSHVLEAIGCPPAEASDSLRISLGPRSTGAEIEQFLRILPSALRSLLQSPGPEDRNAALSRIS